MRVCVYVYNTIITHTLIYIPAGTGPGSRSKNRPDLRISSIKTIGGKTVFFINAYLNLYFKLYVEKTKGNRCILHRIKPLRVSNIALCGTYARCPWYFDITQYDRARVAIRRSVKLCAKLCEKPKPKGQEIGRVLGEGSDTHARLVSPTSSPRHVSVVAVVVAAVITDDGRPPRSAAGGGNASRTGSARDRESTIALLEPGSGRRSRSER